MSYDQTASARQQSRFERWAEDWISDWFGLFDIAIGIITLTAYYPTTQAWWFKKCGRVGDDPIQPNIAVSGGLPATGKPYTGRAGSQED